MAEGTGPSNRSSLLDQWHAGRKGTLGNGQRFYHHLPDAPDGYLNRSDLYAYNRAELANSMAEQAIYLQKALDDIKTLLNVAIRKVISGITRLS